MARLRTNGYETRTCFQNSFASELSTQYEEGMIVGAGTDGIFPTFDTTTVRSGLYSLKCITGNFPVASGVRNRLYQFDWNIGHTHYTRCYVNMTAFASGSAYTILDLQDRLGKGAAAVVTSGGVLQLWINGATKVGANSAALSLNTWYRVELAVGIFAGASDDTCSLRLEGVEVASASGQSIGVDAINTLFVGLRGVSSSFPANMAAYFDDVAWNDDTTTNQNSWPGAGSVVYLRPTSDNTVGTGWVDGDDVGSLFGSVDNTPPSGQTAAAGGTQIKNTTATAVGNYDVNMTTYTAAGVAANASITLIQSFVVHGVTGAVTVSGAIQLVSNPVQVTEDGFQFGDDGTHTGTGLGGIWPANWEGQWCKPIYSPTVVLGTAPVLRLGKRQAVSTTVQACLMGIQVEYAASAVVAAAPHRLALLGVGH